jgi:hypothetical protein
MELLHTLYREQPTGLVRATALAQSFSIHIITHLKIICPTFSFKLREAHVYIKLS